MAPNEMAGWPVSIKEMQFYYRLAEQLMDVSHNYPGGAAEDLILSRLHGFGFTEAIPTPVAFDLQATKHGQIHSNAMWSAIANFGYAINRKHYDLAVKANAVRVLVEQGKATGVEVMSPDKKSYILKSKVVVISGSTFETPRLLLHSGIEGMAIGHYLTNHSYVFAHAKTNRNDFPEILGAIGMMIPQSVERPYQFEIIGPQGRAYYRYPRYEVQPLFEDVSFDILGFGVVEPRYENCVSLDPSRRMPMEFPRFKFNFLTAERIG